MSDFKKAVEDARFALAMDRERHANPFPPEQQRIHDISGHIFFHCGLGPEILELLQGRNYHAVTNIILKAAAEYDAEKDKAA